jgi:hypothetical protein
LMWPISCLIVGAFTRESSLAVGRRNSRPWRFRSFLEGQVGGVINLFL